MATKTVKYNKTGIAELPSDLSVLYRIETASGAPNYIGVAARRRVNETIAAHLGEIPGVKVKVEQFATIAEARKKQANIIKRSGPPKYNK
jgi:hypothetical protein